jgi:MFS-type transporter involved in bile tolerance (Atg22 family)
MIVPAFLTFKIAGLFIMSVSLGTEFDIEENHNFAFAMYWTIDVISLILAAYSILDWRYN